MGSPCYCIRHSLRNSHRPVSQTPCPLCYTCLNPGFLYRAITTPYKLGWFTPKESIRILLTPYERSKPWVLYLTPGLAAAQVLHLLWFLVVARIVRAIFVPNLLEKHDFSIIGLTLYVIFLTLSFIVLCPLEVISTRLAIQRNHETPLDAQDPSNEIGVPYSGEEEDVIGLREEDRPYAGLIDAAKTMVEEEGWSTLYRAWWLTLLGSVLSGL